jgi:predicted kinase
LSKHHPARPGWEPHRRRERREAHGLTLERAGDALRDVAQRHGLSAPAANFQTLWAHEKGEVYPGPHYRRAYCLLYGATEPELGFRLPLPNEAASNGHGDAGSAPATRRLSAVAELVSADAGGARLLAAFRDAATGARPEPAPLVLMAGYAGSGKSELAGALARETGWALIDKDTITRPLVEDLLESLGLDRNDRHSEQYLKLVRPREYECLMEAAYENLSRGVPSVATAPYIAELRDASWMRQAARVTERLGGLLAPIWVRCDAESMREHIIERAAPRDQWKLDHWDTYAAGLADDFTPAGPHLVIDNRHGAAVEHCDRARRAAGAEAVRAATP